MTFRGMVLLIGIMTVFGHAKSLVFPPYLHSYGIRKATPQHLFMFFGATARFDDPQGLTTSKMISRDNPATDKDDDEVIVYGVNSGQNQLIYNTSMWGLASYGSQGNGVGQFNRPMGIASEAHGNVFVADCGNNRIVHLFNPLKKVRWVRAYDGSGNGQTPFNGPTQVALDERCNVYVSDTKNRRLVVFDTAGRVFRTLQPQSGGTFEDGPTTLAVADGRNQWSYYKGERFIFCADRDGTRLWKLDTAGVVKQTITLSAGSRCAYAAIDYYHNIWVTDTRNHCLLKFDHNLNLLDRFGSHGNGDNQFTEPRGLAILKRFGQTFVAERQGAQYFWMGSDCTARTMVRTASGAVQLQLTLTEPSYVSLYVPASGKDTVFILQRKFADSGKWVSDLPMNTRTLSETSFVVRIEPTYSSYTYQSWVYPVTLTK